jgi:hypothetical protein
MQQSFPRFAQALSVGVFIIRISIRARNDPMESEGCREFARKVSRFARKLSHPNSPKLLKTNKMVCPQSITLVTP